MSRDVPSLRYRSLNDYQNTEINLPGAISSLSQIERNSNLWSLLKSPLTDVSDQDRTGILSTGVFSISRQQQREQQGGREHEPVSGGGRGARAGLAAEEEEERLSVIFAVL